MRIPQVIAVDLDGTLLRKGGAISARTVAALDLVRAAGARVVVVTARPPRFVEMLVAEAGVTGLAVCSNGAIVYDIDTGATKIVGALPVALAQRTAELIDQVLPEAGYALETGWRVLCAPGFRHVTSRDPERVDVASRAQMWAQAETAVKLLVWSTAPDTDAVLAMLRAALPDVECTYSGGAGLLEISAVGVTKAGTLATLCAGWGVPAQDVIAFGDMPNDLPVLQWAGTAYAVANAHPSVLAQIGRHTASNNDDGVALVLEEIYRPVS